MLKEKPRSTLLQFMRYLWVGGLAAAVDTGCLYVLHNQLALNYLLAAAIGFTVGLLTNYLISIAWVFESSGRLSREFALFAIIGIGGLGWTELILWFSVRVADASVMTAKAVALAIVLVWNFGMRKRFVFDSGPGPLRRNERRPMKRKRRASLSQRAPDNFADPDGFMAPGTADLHRFRLPPGGS